MTDETMAELAREIADGWVREGWREYVARTDDSTYTLSMADLAWAEEEVDEPVDARDLQRRVQRLLLEALDD